MEKCVLFGAGKIASKIHEKYKEEIVAVIDNDPSKIGLYIWDDIPIISLKDYKDDYSFLPIMITTVYCKNIEKQLRDNNITNFFIPDELWRSGNVEISQNISHSRWPLYLKQLCDYEGKDVLEVGSRVVTGTNFRSLFEKADYIGFDYYAGDNVDVVGDAHRLSHYFDKKFDLIFSSAVFGHLAMPWQASLEMIKLLKPGGYIFVETHYSFSSHERPWHFFQYSENALNVLFSQKFGIKCIEKGCSNPIEGYFSKEADQYLQERMVSDLFCHSEFLGQKIDDIPDNKLSWEFVSLEDVVGGTKYPSNK